jgi:hypothetical protein
LVLITFPAFLISFDIEFVKLTAKNFQDIMRLKRDLRGHESLARISHQ